jgi:hypothetical protein
MASTAGAVGADGTVGVMGGGGLQELDMPTGIDHCFVRTDRRMRVDTVRLIILFKLSSNVSKDG